MEVKEYSLYHRDEILDLYESVGWTNYTARPEMLKGAYENSLLTLAAYEDKALVGIVRVVGDGASIVFIQDLLVRPEFQRKGIGTALMKAVLERYPAVYQMELMTDDTEKTAAFYQSMGFQRAESLGCRAFLRMQRGNRI